MFSGEKHFNSWKYNHYRDLWNGQWTFPLEKVERQIDFLKGNWSINETKGALIYLLVAITLREAYLIVTQVTDYAIFSSEYNDVDIGGSCLLSPFSAFCCLYW